MIYTILAAGIMFQTTQDLPNGLTIGESVSAFTPIYRAPEQNQSEEARFKLEKYDAQMRTITINNMDSKWAFQRLSSGKYQIGRAPYKNGAVTVVLDPYYSFNKAKE